MAQDPLDPTSWPRPSTPGAFGTAGLGVELIGSLALKHQLLAQQMSGDGRDPGSKEQILS